MVTVVGFLSIEGCLLPHPHPSKFERLSSFHSLRSHLSDQGCVSVLIAPQVYTRVFNCVLFFGPQDGYSSSEVSCHRRSSHV